MIAVWLAVNALVRVVGIAYAVADEIASWKRTPWPRGDR